MAARAALNGSLSMSDHELKDSGHDHLIHYKVDDEPETTDRAVLTAKEILTNAGVDPLTNYLTLLVPGHDSISYKDNPETPITMKNGMHFLSKPIGPMPVSCR